jgi:nicotinamidase/pyrazinamidase
MKALLIVDLQNDFLPGGALPAPEGDRIIPVINRIMPHFDLVIGSRDWHPVQTNHFDRWPPHCVRGTIGAEPPGSFQSSQLNEVFLKGTGEKDDGYSAFEATSASLDEYLKEHKISRLFLAGLTLEYCVKATALDAVEKGYETSIVEDATAAINENQGDRERSIEQLKASGVTLIHSDKMKEVP